VRHPKGTEDERHRNILDGPKASVNLMLSQACTELVTLPLAKRNDEAWFIQKVSEAVKRVEK
jgi:hypothetical protein